MTAAQIILKHLVPALLTIQREIDEEILRLEGAQGQAESIEDHPPTTARGLVQDRTAADRYLTVEQVSTLLGLKKPTIYKLISSRRIPYYKLGSRVRFNQQRVVDWMEGKSVDAIAARKRR